MNTGLLRNNLLVLLCYAVVIQLLSLVERDGASMLVLIGMMVCVAAHLSILVLGAVVNLFSGKGPLAGQWLLSALIVGVVGFGTCWGGASLAELYGGATNFH
jgi:hypothetical protein